MLHDEQNTLFTLAADFIHYTNRSLFLTGRAGTGKTTFLRHIKANTNKQTAVVAPTGVAAINAGGATIHSFFQLPFTPYIPESKGSDRSEESIDKHHLLGRLKITNERRKILQQLELLIIDEISMVRCDVLDAIDVVLKHFRNRYAEAFGGVQVLFIGDMFQLPPVVQEDEWKILSPFYQSPFFFDSKVLQQDQPVHIELNKIYRQTEQQFIDLLNKVRNNEMDEEGFALLNNRYNPSFHPQKEAGFITLTTHNYKADAINGEEIGKLGGEIVSYKATIIGEFYEKSYPAEELLQLKAGAQVMMIKNDAEKRYFNGKIGVITKLENEVVHVQCKDEPYPIEVRKEKWQNIRYTLEPATQRVQEEEIGSFEQFPLRLAWAITIHKSQGLTFERAVIDAGAAFASGQVYVALSRCTTLDGIVLKSRISGNGLRNDERIVQFSKQKDAATLLNVALSESKKAYQSVVLKGLFDLTAIVKTIEAFQKFIEETLKDFNEEISGWTNKLEEKINQLQEVANKFQPQLQQMLNENLMPEQNETLQQRIKAASKYFLEQLQQLSRYLISSVAVTDSKQKAMIYNLMLQEVHTAIAQKLHEMKGCEHGFNAEAFAMHKKKFVTSPLRINAYAAASKAVKTDTAHPVLYQQLKFLRDKICAQKDIPVYIVASGDTLNELTRYLPQTLQELGKISGFGKAKLENYGQQFLDIITDYAKQHKLSSLIHEKVPKRERKEKDPNKEKIDTKLETYKLYQSGKSITEIAEARQLSAGTIEGHLAYYVKSGAISVEELVSKEKIVLIEPLAKNIEGGSTTSIKEKLRADISYGEIRLVIASLEYLKQKESPGNVS